VIKRTLTNINPMATMPLVSQTETGSAEVQPARDSQPKATKGRWGGCKRLPPHYINKDHSESCYALKNLLAKGKKSLLSVKWICPFHAEPIHLHHQLSKFE